MDEIARLLIPIEIEKEMRDSYLDYSMSVIIGRALPDVRDGLKPVHRRILYAMWREGLRSNRRYSKCAGVVGEVLKKYHPHGDSAVYDALVRMAQPWNMRGLLVDGQGNFGSVDGDPAAAYRYTECRMTKLAEELLGDDIDKDTVSFVPNFDGATEEPTVLPAAFPNLLVNGSDGIAVGMATKIPPHNLSEIIDALIALIANPDIGIDELMRHVPGPDFPTAGTIYGAQGVYEAYSTGRGKVIVRGRAEFEDLDNGRSAIVIDELPFQVNKARLVQEIADLVKNKKIDGITALRDESDRTGMRVVIELRRDVVREIVLNHLFKHTALQSTFGVILLAIVQNRPQVLDLKEMLQHYLAHRRDIIVRRCRYDLRRALERQHILEAFLTALDHLDEVIALIRGSATPADAREALIARFTFSEVQSQAILDLRLQRLTGMERDKILQEYEENARLIAWLRDVLADDNKVLDLVRVELLDVQTKYSSPRRTRFVEATGELSIIDLIAEEDQAITLSVSGYIKRAPLDEYQQQRRGGLGKTAMKTRAEDSVQEIFVANTHAVLLVFTTHGSVFKVPVYEVPQVGRTAKGTPLVNLVQLEPEDQVTSVLSITDFDEDVDLLFCSRKGLVKRTRLSEYRNMRSSGLRAYDCADGDELLTVTLAQTDRHVLITTVQGMSIRIPPHDFTKGEDGAMQLRLDDAGQPTLQMRHMGRVARGVRGIDLQEGDQIASMQVLESDPDMRLLTITSNGYGKRTVLSAYRVQNRGGKGIIDIVTDERNGVVVGAVQVRETDRVMLITDTGRVIKIGVDGIRETSRRTKGVRLMRIDDDERVVSVARVVEQDDDEEVEAPLVDADDLDEGASEAADDGGGAGEEE